MLNDPTKSIICQRVTCPVSFSLDCLSGVNGVSKHGTQIRLMFTQWSWRPSNTDSLVSQTLNKVNTDIKSHQQEHQTVKTCMNLCF